MKCHRWQGSFYLTRLARALIQYWGERTTFATVLQRCNQNNFCNRFPRPVCDAALVPSLGSYCKSDFPFWTNTACTLRVKIDENGNAAIVHSPTGIEPEAISRKVQNETKTFFRVDWNGNITSVISNCTCFVVSLYHTSTYCSTLVLILDPSDLITSNFIRA